MYKWISFRSNGFLSTHGLFCISIILLFYSEIFLLLFCLSLIANKPRNREKNNIVILILIAIKSTKTHHNTMRAVCLHCFSDLLLLLLGVCVCVCLALAFIHFSRMLFHFSFNQFLMQSKLIKIAWCCLVSIYSQREPF